MIYFCADDYGISAKSNGRIENCLENGVLNKVSVLPNGEITDFKRRLQERKALLCLHMNLVEGKPLSNPSEIGGLINAEGYFKYSFAGLFLRSLSPQRKQMEEQLYKEIKSQLRFWVESLGKESEILIDSHQHTHMIPLVFKTLMRVVKDEGINVEKLRFPAEPITPYLLNPSLFFSYPVSGIAKQWILKILGFVNLRELKKSKIETDLFMGVMFSGRMDEAKITKLLPRYLKVAQRKNKGVEITLHPGYVEEGEEIILGSRKDFGSFYFSPLRKTEYETLLNLKI